MIGGRPRRPRPSAGPGRPRRSGGAGRRRPGPRPWPRRARRRPGPPAGRPGRRTGRACGRRRPDASAARPRASGGGHPGLADVGPGPDDDDRAVRPPGHPARRGRPSRRSTSSSVWAAESVMRSRELPGGTVGGRMAGTSRPRSSSAAEAATARASSPSTTGTMGDGWPGRTRSTWPAAGPPGRRPPPSAGPGPRPGPRRCRPGVEAVVKMKERARLTSRSTRAPGPATKPPSEPSVLDRVPTRRTSAPTSGGQVGAEHGVGLVEHQQGAVVGADRAEGRRGRRRRRPSRTRCR